MNKVNDLNTDRRGIEVDSSHRTRGGIILGLVTLSISGAMTTAVLTSFVSSGWGVALAAIVGGVGGLFVEAFCQVAGAGDGE